MAATYQCTVVTPEKSLFSGLASFVTLPGSEGGMGVLAHHEPTVTTLKPGTVRITQNEEGDATKTYVVNGGYAQIDGERVTVLADRAIDLADINADEVKKNISDLQGQFDSLNGDEAKQAYVKSQLDWEQVKQKALEA